MSGPLASKTYASISAMANAAIAADPQIVALIHEARTAASEDGRDEAIADAAVLLVSTEAGALLTLEGCVDVIAGYVALDLTDPSPQTADIRVVSIPGIEGRPLWVIVDERDAAAMRAYVAPGQVWVRADAVRADDWPRVRAVAADATRRMLGKARPPGRRGGSRNAARAAIVAEVRARPELTDAEIDALGVQAGIWVDSLDDPILVKRRVNRARKDAAINP